MMWNGAAWALLAWALSAQSVTRYSVGSGGVYVTGGPSGTMRRLYAIHGSSGPGGTGTNVRSAGSLIVDTCNDCSGHPHTYSASGPTVTRTAPEYQPSRKKTTKRRAQRRRR